MVTRRALEHQGVLSEFVTEFLDAKLGRHENIVAVFIPRRPSSILNDRLLDECHPNLAKFAAQNSLCKFHHAPKRAGNLFHCGGAAQYDGTASEQTSDFIYELVPQVYRL